MQGKVVVITGASRGIGAAAARVFADAGARVALLARGTDETQALSDQIGAERSMALACDVGSWDQVAAAVQAVVARFGRIDVLINNAGVIDPIGHLGEADPVEWGLAVDINLKGVFHGMRAAIPLMRGQGGTVLTVSSGAAHHALEGWSAYCAAKAGAAMLTSAVHLEEAGHGLRVMGLSPGTVATEMQVKIKASGMNAVSQLDPAVHVPADWPARALLWMCGSAADAHLGKELSLRDDWLRKAVGLV